MAYSYFAGENDEISYWRHSPWLPRDLDMEPPVASITKPALKRRAKKRSVPMTATVQKETATLTSIENFEKIVKQHAAKKVGDASEILENIERIKNAVPSVYEEAKIKAFLSQRAKALSVLMQNLLVAKLSSQFPMLDPGIFEMKRHLFIKDGTIVEDRTKDVKETKKANHVEVPLFAIATLNEKKITLGKQRIRTGNYYNGYTSITNTISATVPQPPASVAEQGRKALSVFHGAFAEMYSNKVTSDLVEHPPAPELEVMWIPTAQSLSLKVDVVHVPAPRKVDPALVLRCGSHRYLIGLWDIVDEKPFDGILREFTIGLAKFPDKAKE